MRTIAEHAQYFVEIQGFLIDGAINMFGHVGMPVEHAIGPVEANVEGPAVMAVIGYASSSMRGALLILTSREIAAELQPIAIRRGPPSETALRDVLGEFCNMLVGRIKNRLVRRGVAPLTGTPTTVLGDRLQLPVPTSGLSAWHRFAVAAGDIHVRLDTTFELEFAMAAADNADEAPELEGDVILF
jgi:hypothetical protein